MRRNQLFSIFIPTYNRANLLAETLNSLISQISEDQIEIIISDNNSTDTTKKTVETFIQQYYLEM